MLRCSSGLGLVIGSWERPPWCWVSGWGCIRSVPINVPAKAIANPVQRHVEAHVGWRWLAQKISQRQRGAISGTFSGEHRPPPSPRKFSMQHSLLLVNHAVHQEEQDFLTVPAICSASPARCICMCMCVCFVSVYAYAYAYAFVSVYACVHVRRCFDVDLIRIMSQVASGTQQQTGLCVPLLETSCARQQ